MKKVTVGKLVIGFALLVIGFGCKKYDEGPGLSLRTKKARATAEWIVKTLTSNGVDVLNENFEGNYTCTSGGKVYYSDGYQTTRLIWNFKENGDIEVEDVWILKTFDFSLSYDLCDDYYKTSNGTTLDKGTWEFASNKKEMLLKFNSDPTRILTLEIKELREVEMKLEGIINGEILKITLSKK
jgi:hypothetical protein